MRKKVGQSLAAVAVILTITSMTGAGADGGGRGDQHTCTSSKSLEAMSCLDKYEKDGKEVYCVTATVHDHPDHERVGGVEIALSCDWEHAKQPNSK